VNVTFTLGKTKRSHWEIIAEIEEAGAVRIWRGEQQPTKRDFDLIVRAAMAGMAAMANIVGVNMEPDLQPGGSYEKH
jgi:hypothetical protein